MDDRTRTSSVETAADPGPVMGLLADPAVVASILEDELAALKDLAEGG